MSAEKDTGNWYIEVGPVFDGPGPGDGSDAAFEVVFFSGKRAEAIQEAERLCRKWENRLEGYHSDIGHFGVGYALKDRKEKKDLCYRCNKNEAVKYGDISFVYLNLTIKIFKTGLICIDCAKNEWIKDFEENAKEFISEVNGKPKVNWRHYREYFDMGRLHDQKERFHYLLIGLGVLSLEVKGNWEIVADGPIGLNPKTHVAYLYFTRKEDAVEFARLERGRTLYHWDIHHIDEVISKEKALKRKRG